MSLGARRETLNKGAHEVEGPCADRPRRQQSAFSAHGLASPAAYPRHRSSGVGEPHARRDPEAYDIEIRYGELDDSSGSLCVPQRRVLVESQGYVKSFGTPRSPAAWRNCDVPG